MPDMSRCGSKYEILRTKQETLSHRPSGLPNVSPPADESPDATAGELAAARHDYAALVDASQVLTRQNQALQERIAELEAVNKRLVDMVWGRRSERRKDSPGQLPLDFSGEPLEPPSPEQQEVITAQALADEAFDRELLRVWRPAGKPGGRSGPGANRSRPTCHGGYGLSTCRTKRRRG